MNASELGRILVNAQDEIASLKKQLAFVQPSGIVISSNHNNFVDGMISANNTNNTNNNNSTMDNNDTQQQIYSRLTYTIKKFENALQNNVDKMLTHNMTQVDPQLMLMQQQRLPLISRNSGGDSNPNNLGCYEEQPVFLMQQKKLSRTHGLPRNSQNRSFETSNNTSCRNADQSSSFLLNGMSHNKSFEIGKAIIQGDNSLQNPHQRRIRQNSANIYHRAEPITKRAKAGRVSKPAQVLPPEIRNNPFADPIAITESEIYSGLYNLINKGVVPRDVDIMPAFLRGVPPLQNKPARMHEFRQKLLKQEINNVDPSGDIMTLKLDVLSITQPQQSQQQQQHQQQQLPPSNQAYIDRAQSLMNYRKRFKGKENNLNNLISKLKNEDTFEIKQPMNPRGYPEVLDAYSLHHLMVRRGQLVEETPEFFSYKRIFQGEWGKINQILKQIQDIAVIYQFPLFYIDGKKVAALTEKMTKPKLEDLLNCIVNQAMVDEYVKLPGRKYLGDKGKVLAAIKIQSIVRRFVRYREYQRIKHTIVRVRIIQLAMRLYLNKLHTKQKIKRQNENQLKLFTEKMEAFKLDWPVIKLKKRIEIHINSFSFNEMKRLTMEKQLQRENIQITRVFNIRDPMVSIIYVCPFSLSPDITNYYYKILELGDVQNFRDRLYFIEPENSTRFPSHFSLSRKLLYSPQALQRIRKLIKNKTAYMISGFPSNDDIYLCQQLAVPQMAGLPNVHYSLSTKSNSKGVFKEAGIDTPIGASDIYDEIEFINTLTLLIATHGKNISTWIFKIDDESQGRGIAYFNVSQCQGIMQILSRFEEDRALFEGQQYEQAGGASNKEYLKPQQIPSELIHSIKTSLEQYLQTATVMAVPSLFQDFNEYLRAFLKSGGIIEGSLNQTRSSQQSLVSSPSLGFFIDPTGNTSVIAASDRIQGQPFVNIGCQFPQKSFSKHIDLSALARQIGNVLYARGIFGYVSADFLATENDVLQGIGIDCYLNNNVSSFFYFHYLMNGSLNRINSNYTITNNTHPNSSHHGSNNTLSLSHEDQSERSYFYCPFVHHAGLSTVRIKNFFQMCRFESIQFDLEKKYGATFLLVDVLQAGGIGVLTIGEDSNNALSLMNMALSFLMKQAGSTTKSYSEAPGQARSDCVSILEMISRVKIMTKKIARESIQNAKRKQ